MRAMIWLLLAGGCLGVPVTAAAAPASVADTAGLRPKLQGALAGYPGVAGVSVRDLRTAEVLSIRGGEPFPSASLIKISVLVALLEEIEAGKYLSRRLFIAGQGRPTGETWPGLVVEYRTPGGFLWRTTWEPRYLPREPSLATDQVVDPKRVSGSFLIWERRF